MLSGRNARSTPCPRAGSPTTSLEGQRLRWVNPRSGVVSPWQTRGQALLPPARPRAPRAALETPALVPLERACVCAGPRLEPHTWNGPEAPKPSRMLRGNPISQTENAGAPFRAAFGSYELLDTRSQTRSQTPAPALCCLAAPNAGIKGLARQRIPSGPGIRSCRTSLPVSRPPSCSPSEPHHSENATAPGDQGPQHSSHTQLIPCPRGRPQRAPPPSEPLARDPSCSLALCRGPRGYLTPRGTRAGPRF